MEHSFVEDYILDTVDFDSLAIVMNGPMREDYGEEIDACNSVIRFNVYQTKGYEKEVGSKTTHWIVNGDHSVIKDQNLPALCPFPHYKYKSVQIYRFRSKWEPLIFTQFDYRKSAPENMPYPTTGFTFLMMMLHLDRGPFTVYGFNGLQEGHYFNAKHTHSSRHSGNREFSHISKKYKKEIIIK